MSSDAVTYLPQLAVQGWADSNAGDDQAVIINPNASTRALVSWATAQVEQANVLLEAVGCGVDAAGVLDPGEVAGAIRHFTGQAEQVLKAACERAKADGLPGAEEGPGAGA